LELQDIGAIATIVGTSLTLVAIVVALFQIHQLGQVEKSSNKANISVRYEYGTVREGKAVFIVFENHGRSSATKVQLFFDDHTKWHFVKHPSSLPFQTEQGIQNLFPGAKLQYFVGRPLAKSPFEDLRTKSIPGLLSYKDDIVGPQTLDVSLTLQDQTFIAK
jgi:hypothetical protein